MKALFIPKRAFFEKEALEYPIGKSIYNKMKEIGVEINIIGSHNRVTGIPGATPTQAYYEGKRTLVVGVRRSKDFQTCKPSAHYQLPLSTSCPGMCEYCYLNTTLGKKPYIRVYVNIYEILKRTEEYIEEAKPEITIFEGAATSDPIPVEPYTGNLKKTIQFFAKQDYGRFRFVTKFTEIESLLNIDHGNHTCFRFSLNTDNIIKKYEHNTPSAEERIYAASKVCEAGYDLGFIIGPIIMYDNWKEDYQNLFKQLKSKLPSQSLNITFELITHRFTKRAKNNILEIFPNTSLPMDESSRKFKFGQFGYGKYIYPPESFKEMSIFFTEAINDLFPNGEILYFV